MPFANAKKAYWIRAAELDAVSNKPRQDAVCSQNSL